MGEAIVFTSITDAMRKGRHSFKHSFDILQGDEGNEEAISYQVMYNAKWNSLAKSLNSAVPAFFAAIYTVGNMADAELKVEPGLSNTREVVRGWRDIVQKLHPAFVDEITSLRATMFSNPELETDLSAALRKKRHEGQEIVFRKLHAAAAVRLEELDDFVSDQVDIRFKTFCERIRGAELNILMREVQ